MADHNDLQRTIAALRQDVPMRSEWRSAVMREVRALGRPAPAAPTVHRSPRRWSLHPTMAIAAGLVCAVAGGTIALRVQPNAKEPNAGQPSAPSPSEVHGVVPPAMPVRFVFVAPNASTVSIVGDFNAWSPTATPMRRLHDGLWSIDVDLPSGRHTYGFVVDGVLRADPDALRSADDDFGVPSSVVLVADGRT
jgi:hypothetical protein